MSSASASQPLKIAVVGAGLAGLATTISLRRAGHIVDVFEISALNKEVGAAIVVPPNEANSGLFRIRRRESESCRLFWGKQGMVQYSGQKPEGTLSLFRMDASTTAIKHACVLEGTSTMSSILTSKSSEKFEADVIIAADGKNSTLRTIVAGERVPLPVSGRCSFRWVLDASKLEGPSEFDWVQREGIPGLRIVGGATGLLHSYKGEQGEDLVRRKATRAEMLEECTDFVPKFRAFAELAPEELSIWGHARSADSPNLDQGPPALSRGRCARRLAAHEILRKERGEFVCRESLEQAMIPSKRGLYARHSDVLAPDMQHYLLGHDAVRVAQEYFEKNFAVL
ncbi:FAD/NAD(P)-binding domain-containing protein, partial [Mycena rebaudengoi]